MLACCNCAQSPSEEADNRGTQQLKELRLCDQPEFICNCETSTKIKANERQSKANALARLIVCHLLQSSHFHRRTIDDCRLAMKRERSTVVAPLDWPTSKCQRALRPLKLKIAVLERTLSASHSVFDGLTAWSATIQRRSKHDPSPEDAALYLPPVPYRASRYGASRKQRPKTDSNKDCLSKEAMLDDLRSRSTGAVSSAYIGVYLAFTAILDRTRTRQKFPSLSTRASYAVGRCVHLTSESFTDEPIEADTWYEAVPSYCRSGLVLGQAVQLLLSSAQTLKPLLPLIALSLQDSPLSQEVMYTILDMTDLAHCRKSDVEYLSKLANRISMPWALKIHFAREIRLEQLTQPAFSYLLELRSTEAIMDDSTQALYLKTTNAALQALKRRKELKTDAELHLYDLLQDMSCRIFSCDDTWVLPLLQESFEQSFNTQMLLPLALGYSLALLPQRKEDPRYTERLQALTRTILLGPITTKADCLTYLLDALSSDTLARIVHCLVGKIDELALALANSCASTFKEDFVEWAADIEQAVYKGQSQDKTGKYRYEPLLDSWVAKTPAASRSNRRQPRRLMIESSDESEDDDKEAASADDNGYEADRSQTHFSTAELECEDDEDFVKLLSQSAKKMPKDVLKLLTIERTSDVTQSAKLLRRLSRQLTSDHCDVDESSPLQRMQKPSRTSRLSRFALPESPTPSTLIKRSRSPHDGLLHTEKSTAVTGRRRVKRVRANEHSAASLHVVYQVSPSPVAKRVRRELENLKSSFIAKPRRNLVLQQLQTQEANMQSEAQDADFEDEFYMPNCPKSDCDELSML